MTKTIDERIQDSLNILEDFLKKNDNALKNIEELLELNFQAEELLSAVEGIELMYGEDISQSVTRFLSFPKKTIKIIQEGKYQYGESYKLLILKYKEMFLRLRKFEETGRTTLMKISEETVSNVFNFTIQRVDNTYFDFKVSHENQLSIINYLMDVFKKHISESNDLDVEELNDFISDLKELNVKIKDLESLFDDLLEEKNDGKNL